MIPREYKIRGNVEWDSEIPILAEPSNLETKTTGFLEYPEIRSKEITFMGCPRCDKLESNVAIKLQKTDLERNIKCQHCAKLRCTKDWKCPCDIKWTLCREHCKCAVPNLASTIPGKIARCQTSTHRKSKRPVSSNDRKLDIPEEPTGKRQRTNAHHVDAGEGLVYLDHVPPKRPRILGPVLAARFGYPKRDHCA